MAPFCGKKTAALPYLLDHTDLGLGLIGEDLEISKVQKESRNRTFSQTPLPTK
jgi:hypothetical protein